MCKKEFEMSEEDYQKLLDASQPVPYIVIGGVTPKSPQENANDAWKALGDRMGFDHMSVEPIRHKGDRFFMATPKVIEAN